MYINMLGIYFYFSIYANIHNGMQYNGKCIRGVGDIE